MIEINEKTSYDETKEFSEQSEEFQEYYNELYSKKVTEKVKTGYPDFNEDGSITFNFEDEKLKFEVKRVQNNPFSTSNRSVKETIVNITVK